MGEFWFEVMKMNIKEHGITKYNPIWTITLLFMILALVGVFALPSRVLKKG